MWGLIRVHKDPLPIDAQSNVIYRIASVCKNCEASYVGQSKQVKTTISKHCNHIAREISDSSMMIDTIDYNTIMNLIGILDRKRNFKRLTSEMLHIKTQKMSLN